MTRLFGLALAACVTMAASAAANAQHLVQAPGGNPVIAASGNHVTGVTFDAFGNPIVHRHQDQLHASAMDPNRGHVDPGSLHYVNELRYDSYGRPYYMRGYRWTSYGVPHGNVTTTWATGNSSPYPNTPYPNMGTQSVSNIYGGYPQGTQSVTSSYVGGGRQQSFGRNPSRMNGQQAGRILQGAIRTLQRFGN